MLEIQTKQLSPLFLSEREENERRIVNGINYPITTRETNNDDVFLESA